MLGKHAPTYEVDPAYAGMNLSTSTPINHYRSGPRVCGDEPTVKKWEFYNMRGPRVCGDEPVFALDPERTELWTPRMRG